MMTALALATVGVLCSVIVSILNSPVVHAPAAERSASPPRASTSQIAGRWIRARVGQSGDAAADRSIGRAVFAIVATAWLNVGLAVMAVFVLWARSLLVRRRNTHQREEQISAGLADVIDLFAVALLSGNTVAEATRQVCEWSDGEFAEAFAWCLRRVSNGQSLSDVLESLPERLGPQTRPLIAALVSTERYGAPITAGLAQLAADTRADRRRRAEAAARRLPVELLFPLVVCVLPAFLLVTVVPVIVQTVSNLDVVASP